MNNLTLHRLTAEEKKIISEKKFAELLEKYKSEGHSTEKLKSIPESMQRLYLDVLVGQKSPMKAIKLKCLECTCWQRPEVTTCNIKTCALWNLRPFQSKSEVDVDSDEAEQEDSVE